MIKVDNDLGQIPEQNRWTRQAALCYYLGFNCNKCDLPEDIIKICHMKPVVLELVRKFGKPPEKLLDMIKGEFGEDIILEE